LHYSPPDFTWTHGLKPHLITEAVLNGARKALKDFGIQSNFICDLCRAFGPKKGLALLDAITPYVKKSETSEPHVIAVGLGGPEEPYPPELFKDVFEEARKRGFHVSIHAGEAAGPTSIWNAVLECKTERIGHGVRCVDDDKLIKLLKEKQIPLEVCPTSNLRTFVLNHTKFEQHPIRKLYDRGLMVTVNSDDPLFFGSNLENELYKLHKLQGFSVKQLQHLMVNAIEASFLTNNEKAQLKKEFFHS
jgi:adenosine deaminase